MKLDVLSIAAGTVLTVLSLLLLMFAANCYGQLKTTGLYIPPQDFIDIVKATLAISVSILAYGATGKTCKVLEKKEKADVASITGE